MTDNSSPAGRSVLVVDDEPHIRQVLAIKLRAAGYEVYLAEDGLKGLQIARDKHPDVIISDFRMPNMNGLEMCDALLASPDTAKIPVILLTAYEGEVLREPLGERHIHSMMNKPFSPTELLRIVAEVFEAEK
jgi:CheY-like chemotaxis protein